MIVMDDTSPTPNREELHARIRAAGHDDPERFLAEFVKMAGAYRAAASRLRLSLELSSLGLRRQVDRMVATRCTPADAIRRATEGVLVLPRGAIQGTRLDLVIEDDPIRPRPSAARRGKPKRKRGWRRGNRR